MSDPFSRGAPPPASPPASFGQPAGVPPPPPPGFAAPPPVPFGGGVPAPPGQPPPGPPRSGSPWPLLLAVGAAVVVLVVVAVAGVAVVLALRDDPAEEAAPPPLVSAEVPATAAEVPEPSEAPEPGPDEGPVHPETGPDGPPGPVAGPTFGEEEETYLMELSGRTEIPFDFRTPLGWGCLGSAQPNPGAVRQVCIYDGGTFPVVEGGPGGIIEVAPCPSPCDEQEWERLRTAFPDPEVPWQEIDDTTWYAETGVIETEDGPKVGLRMSRIFAAESGDEIDTHVTVRMSGHPEELPVLQKIVNEIHAVTS